MRYWWRAKSAGDESSSVMRIDIGIGRSKGENMAGLENNLIGETSEIRDKIKSTCFVITALTDNATAGVDSQS